MQKKPLILALLAGIALSGAAHATLIGRDLNGSFGFEAYYDTDRNITWLANANVNGRMTWAAANTWAANLSFTDGVNTYDNWRLPTVTDTGTSGCNFADTGTDCGYNVDTATGEMAHLFYDELGNKAFYDAAGAGPQTGWGLTNTGPFTNLQANYYWSATEFAPHTGYAWLFDFDGGGQGADFKDVGFYALAVSPGDVGAANGNTVPEPQTLALVGLGLLGLAVARRRG